VQGFVISHVSIYMRKLVLFLLSIIFFTAIPVSAQDQGMVISNNQTTVARVGCFKFTQNLGFTDGPRNNKQTAVLELQQALYSSGYLKVIPTGYFGILTLRATMLYQKDNAVSQTGFVGPITRGVLRSQFCSTTPPIAMCDYAAPPEGCTYVPGVDYNSETKCGMVLSCGNNATLTDNCKVWFDGCNTCSRTTPGGPLMCTLMACNPVSQAQAHCKEYFSKLRFCPDEKIVDMMPIVCIQAPCNPIDNSYYIYQGQRRELVDFDTTWVKNNCTVPETVVH
jgi:hypothetical protein